MACRIDGDVGAQFAAAVQFATAAQVVLIIVMSILNAMISPNEPDDERDAHIASRSTRYSVWILQIGVFFGVALLIMQQLVVQANNGDTQSMWLHPLMGVHLLALVAVVSEVVRYATTAVDYRTQ